MPDGPEPNLATSQSHKRKRSSTTVRKPASSQPSCPVTLILSDEKATGNYVGPALVTFPDVQPDSSTTRFGLYRHKSNDKAPVLLLGDTDEIEYRSEPSADPAGCTYMLGLHSASAGELKLFPTRFCHMRTVVKQMREADEALTAEQPVDGLAARHALGAAFGTKKSHRAIQAAARNRVDPVTMGHVESQLSAAITQNSSCLPTAVAQAHQTDANRPIPAFNRDATSPQDVYALSDVVSAQELNSIPLANILAAPNAALAAPALPSRDSKFTKARLEALWARCPDGHFNSKDVKALRILVYINYLISIRRTHEYTRKSLARKLTAIPSSPVPEQIIDGLLARFTETFQTHDGVVGHRMTSFTRVKLLSYIAVLSLIHDDYYTRLSGLAEDLQEPFTRIQEIYRGLGCQFVKLPLSEVEAEAQAEIAAKDVKKLNALRTIAKLIVPLVFPPPKLKRQRGPG